MTLTEIYNKLKAAVTSDNKLDFFKAIAEIGLPLIAKRFSDSLAQQSLVFGGVEITMPDENNILIQGETDVFEESTLAGTLKLTYQNNILQAALIGSFTGERLALPGVNWINFGEPSIELTVANDSSTPHGKFGGNVNAGVSFDIFVTYPVSKDKWLFQVAFTEQYSISNFLGLVGGENIVGLLPSPINAFADLAPQEIDVSYATEAKVIDYVAINIGTSPDHIWEILPKVSMKNLLIKCLVENPGDSSKRATSFQIDGIFNIGTGDNVGTFDVVVQVPEFAATVNLSEGKVALGDLLSIFWNSVDVNSPVLKTLNKAYISIFNLSIDTATKNFLLNTRIDSDWTFITVGSTSLTMTGLTLDINYTNGTTLGAIAGMFHIGQTPETGIDLNISASHPSKDAGWVFNANTKGSIDIGAVITTFFADLGVPLPDWVAKPAGVPLIVKDIDFIANVPPEGGEIKNSYNVKGTVSWGIDFEGFKTTIEATPDITYDENKPSAKRTSGKIIGDIDFLGLEFQIGYLFGGTNTLYVEWNGLKGSYSTTETEQTFEVTIENKTLGNLITDLIRTFSSGFTLGAPWNVLNDINLSGFSLKYIKIIKGEKAGETKFELDWDLGLDLGFLSFKNLKITKDNSGVFLGFEGTFLGMEITAGNPDTEKLAGKGSDVTDMPKAPGLGEKYFDLKYLGLGQHVALYPVDNLESVEQATDALMNVFKEAPKPVNGKPVFPIGPPPATVKDSVLIYSEESNWLIGTKFTIVNAIDVSIIFNDPNLYGLLIAVGGDFQYFKGLKFEILYKKINDTIGVYQMELTLPDYLRQLEFGAVSITLPVIGVEIYTNGNFKIDLGFPASITNFSRSFAIQAFPFIGQGGFYFASLTGATSKKVPITTQGEFNPVFEFGIGLSLGLGKTIEKGILKAGLTVTFIGIIEGVIAKYNAYPKSSSNSLKGDGKHYYWLQGTFGLVGKLFGEINFAIISARVDITVYAYIRVTIEAYKAIPVYLEAGVSVRLTVKINLGLFKISIKLSFKTTISANFTIGHDTTTQAPWYDAPAIAGPQRNMILESINTPSIIKWQPLKMEGETPLTINLYYMPHLSVSGESGTQQATYANTLYIDSPAADAGSLDGTTSLEHFARGVLAWTINALINSTENDTQYKALLTKSVTIDQLNILSCYIGTRENNMAPFNFSNTSGNDIKSFLENFFTFTIHEPNSDTNQEIQAGLMPMLPVLNLETTYNQNTPETVNFETDHIVDAAYLQAIQKLFAQMSVSYLANVVNDDSATDICANISDPDYEIESVSVANYMFTDFITLIAKSTLQNAADYMSANGKTSISISELLDAVNTVGNMSTINGQSSRYMLHGIRLPQYPIPANPDNIVLKPLYELTGQQITLPTGLKVDDAYTLSLKANSGINWVNFNGSTSGKASITLDNNEIQRILDTKAISLSPTLTSTSPANMPLINNALQAFTFKSDIDWQYPSDLFPTNKDVEKVNPTIWKLPDSMLDALASYDGNPVFDIQTITREGESSVTKTPIEDFMWSTFLEVTVQKIDPSGGDSPTFDNALDVIGADEAGIVFLEKLMTYINSIGNDDFIDQIQFLYVPNKTNTATNADPTGLVSAANGNVDAALVQANLSTETNPVVAQTIRAAITTEEEDPNVRNGYKDFIRLLWQCSIVRTGGYYLYYVTKDDQKSFPPYLFNEDTTGTIYMAITYNKFINSDFINSLVVGDKIDTSQTSLYATSGSLTQKVSTLPAGVIGFEIDRNDPGAYNPPTENKGVVPPPSIAEDNIYLENQFNLLGYQLEGITNSRNIMPIGAADELDEDDVKALKAETYTSTDDGIWKYRGVIPYHKFTTSSIPVEPNLPSPENDPYAGIGNTATIQFNWQDMFGNEITTPIDSQKLTPTIQYTDLIVGLSLWPAVTAGYQFDAVSGSPEITLDLWFDLGRYKSNPDTAENQAAVLQKAQADIITYTTLYYQLGHGTDLSIYFQSSIDGTMENPDGTKRPVNQEKLYAYVKSIIKFLNAVIDGKGKYPDTPGVQVPYIISDPIVPSTIASYKDIYELTVNFTIERIANYDPDFDDTGVVISTTSIQPPTPKDTDTKKKKKKQKVSDNDPAVSEEPMSLTEFAKLFESTFVNQPTEGITLKIATGVTREGTDKEKNKKVWIVRFDTNGLKGINYSYDNLSPYFFSTIPLANHLTSYKDVDIFNYKSGESFPTNPKTPQKQNFSGIDLDTWGRNFLVAVDDFLNAKYAVPAYLLDNGVQLQQVLDQKQKLAEAIEGTMDYIIEPTDKSKSYIENAQEKFKQSILIKLANTYAIDTVVQIPMTVMSSYEGDNYDPPTSKKIVPRLYGKMIGENPQEGTPSEESKAYSLSNAKVPIGVNTGENSGASWLNYLVNAKQAADQRKFSFGNMVYEVTHIEHQIDSLPHIDDYLASSWLTFVLPLTKDLGNVGEIDIPIPLRAYPTPPSIITQDSSYNSGDASGETTIANARKWGYTYNYARAGAAQDTIITQIELNIPNEESGLQSRSADVKVYNLPERLAQFTSVYSQIQADFITYLSQVTDQTPPTSDEFKYAKNAVAAFVTLVAWVAETWDDWNQVNRRGTKTKNLKTTAVVPKAITYKYTISETTEMDTDYLEVSIKADSSNPDNLMPTVNLIGNDETYEAHKVPGKDNAWTYTAKSTGKTILFNERDSIPERKVTLESLDIINEQNAWSGAQITRNQELLQNPDGKTWQKTNKHFIYKTPMVKFYNKLNPLLVNNMLINVAEIDSTNTPQNLDLAQHLKNLFGALVKEMQVPSMNLKLEVAYEYSFTGTETGNDQKQFPISLPVLLATPFDLNDTTDLAIGETAPYCPVGNDGFVCMLTNTILSWFTQNSPNQTDGLLRFKIELNSSFSQMPMLKLQNALLDIIYIKDLKE